MYKSINELKAKKNEKISQYDSIVNNHSISVDDKLKFLRSLNKLSKQIHVFELVKECKLTSNLKSAEIAQKVKVNCNTSISVSHVNHIWSESIRPNLTYDEKVKYIHNSAGNNWRGGSGLTFS